MPFFHIELPTGESLGIYCGRGPAAAAQAMARDWDYEEPPEYLVVDIVTRSWLLDFTSVQDAHRFTCMAFDALNDAGEGSMPPDSLPGEPLAWSPQEIDVYDDGQNLYLVADSEDGPWCVTLTDPEHP